MRVTVFNTAHFEIKVGQYKFPPFKETQISIGPVQSALRDMRCCKALRIDRIDNKQYIKELGLIHNGNKINFCYDIQNQHAGAAYKYVIKSFANPILKYLTKSGYANRPLTSINCRFFSSKRINQYLKAPVGPNDIFFSHGIADKNYWIGKCIEDYKYAFVPGPAWKKRMIETGYKGEIFICGYTKLDPLLNGEVEKNIYDKPYIVWMPTHGYNYKNSGRSSYPQCIELINQIPEEYKTKLCIHPTSKLNSKEKQLPTFNDLLDADIVIADAGSTLYEAWIMGKSVIFPDWLCKNDILNHFKNDPNNFEYRIYNENIGYHAKDMNHLIKLIEIALRDGMQQQEKEFINEIYPNNIRGSAGKIAAKYLNQIAKSLNIKG